MQSSTAQEKLKEAHRIVGFLARGLDPANDSEVLRVDVLNRPEVIRALLLAADALTATMVVDPSERSSHVGAPWSENEEDKLRRAIARRDTLQRVAAGHGRSSSAITARAVQMGLAEDRVAAKILFGMDRYS